MFPNYIQPPAEKVAILPVNTVLLVLAVREPGLRSILATQLFMPEVDLVTAQDIDQALRRNVRRPAVLIMDAQTVAERPSGWVSELLAEPHWRCVIVVVPDGGAPMFPDERLEYLEKSAVRGRMADLLPVWLSEEPE